MSRFFPHTPYAEDQPFFGTILTTHVLYRGFQTGAFLGLAASSATSAIKRQAVLPTALRATGNGAILGTALMIPGLAIRMWGREEIEWRDRSWRLLENRGQMEVDDWSLAGTLAGGLATSRKLARGQARANLGSRRIRSMRSVQWQVRETWRGESEVCSVQGVPGRSN